MERSEVNARASFAMYLETAGPGEAAERMRRWCGPTALRDVQDFWSGRLTGPHATVERVLEMLGPPDDQGDSILRYELPTRPEYVYTFEFGSPNRNLRWCGFRRSGALPVPWVRESDPVQFAGELARTGATAEEIRTWLGAPAREYGWWPIEVWEYVDGLVLQLRHGVVEVA